MGPIEVFGAADRDEISRIEYLQRTATQPNPVLLAKQSQCPDIPVGHVYNASRRYHSIARRAAAGIVDVPTRMV